MIEFFLIPSLVSMVLLVWFHTEAFMEYATLFSGNRFFYIDDFKEKQKKDPTLDWIMYLQIHHDSFFIRLITCPMCLSFWITLALCVATHELAMIPIYYILSLVAYKATIKLLES
jgi:hypothetical protein